MEPTVLPRETGPARRAEGAAGAASGSAPTAAWFCVQTLGKKEDLAHQHLCRQGFEAFLPRIRKTRRHARRVETVLAPLFPTYLFVQIDTARQRWRCINGTLGVARLLTTRDAPLQVPPGVVETLLEVSGEGGLFEEERLEQLHPNDAVRILTGPFADRLATVARLGDGGRVQLLMEILGGSVLVTLPRAALLKSA